LQPANDFIASVKRLQNIELPQARCSVARFGLACLLQQRAGYKKLLRQFTTEIATRRPTVNGSNELISFSRIPRLALPSGALWAGAVAL
jgi:hypothetical protein